MGIIKSLFGWCNRRKKDIAGDEIVVTATSEPIKSKPKTTEPAPKKPTTEETSIKAPEAAEPKKKRTRTKKEEPKSEPVAEPSAKEPTPPTKTKRRTASKEEPKSEQDAILSDEGEALTASKPERSGRFEIKRARDGRYVFNLYASNHVIIATSQVYSSAQSALNGVKSVMANAENSPIEDQTLKSYTTLPYPKWELYQDNGGQYRFRLCASNGSCICHSQGYTSKANAKGGIVSIQRFAATADIDKAYLDR